MEKILIKNGIVFDGSGNKEEQKDILIKNNIIDSIGNFKGKKADVVIDASGLFVCPGFVDINSDSDHQFTIFTEPLQEGLLKQGITSIIGGNCGSSLAPISAGDLRSIGKWVDISKVNVDWGAVEEFLTRLERVELGLNFGTLIGHSTIRRGVIGEELRDLSDDEFSQMKFLIERGLSNGAFGLSTGLEYSHSRIAPQIEIAEIVKIVKRFNALYATHLRSQKEGLFASIVEIEDLIEMIGIENIPKIEISHLKSYQGLEEELDLGLGVINRLAKSGVDINFDVYPYSTAGAILYSYLPHWATRGGFDRLVKNIGNKSIRKLIVNELSKKKIDYSKIVISEANNMPFSAGKTISQLSKKWEMPNEEVILEILYFARGRATVFEKVLSWRGTIDLLKNPLCFLTTNDAGKRIEKKSESWPHPRAFGSFPKFLGLVRDNKIISWSEAIKKITSSPSLKLGLENRGLIKEGYFADITIFDSKNINSLASVENPHSETKGIEYVLVNGKIAVEKGKLSGIANGKVLRKKN
jgi:N-acyl-D-amino-acid deacylase